MLRPPYAPSNALLWTCSEPNLWNNEKEKLNDDDKILSCEEKLGHSRQQTISYITVHCCTSFAAFLFIWYLYGLLTLGPQIDEKNVFYSLVYVWA